MWADHMLLRTRPSRTAKARACCARHFRGEKLPVAEGSGRNLKALWSLGCDPKTLAKIRSSGHVFGGLRSSRFARSPTGPAATASPLDRCAPQGQAPDGPREPVADAKGEEALTS